MLMKNTRKPKITYAEQREVALLKDEPGHRIAVEYEPTENLFRFISNWHGQVTVIELSAPEFIALLRAGLDHYGLSNGIVDKLASKLIQ